ncbi:hypothetical protein Gogos_012724, partial [Gossypium gossypioides]|nr:hypothetical protein [Gossypium gossypioides]
MDVALHFNLCIMSSFTKFMFTMLLKVVVALSGTLKITLVFERSSRVTLSSPSQTAISLIIMMCLLGASDNYSQDQYIQVTLAFKHFGKELIQRMPRCRWGFIHVVNNDYTHWKMYAIE